MASSVIIKNRLREVRTGAGFRTQSELAERLAVRQTTISAIENDENFASRDLLAGLCEVLGCQPGDIFIAEKIYHPR